MHKRRQAPKLGEHVTHAMVVTNPRWPKGDGPYMDLCPGCTTCEDHHGNRR